MVASDIAMFSPVATTPNLARNYPQAVNRSSQIAEEDSEEEDADEADEREQDEDDDGAQVSDKDDEDEEDEDSSDFPAEFRGAHPEFIISRLKLVKEEQRGENTKSYWKSYTKWSKMSADQKNNTVAWFSKLTEGMKGN